MTNLMKQLDDIVPGKSQDGFRDTQVTVIACLRFAIKLEAVVCRLSQVNYLKRAARYIAYLRNIERADGKQQSDEDLSKIHQHANCNTIRKLPLRRL